MRPLTEPKLSKRQRKAKRGYPSFFLKREKSGKNTGEEIQVGSTRYKGATPKFTKVVDPKTNMSHLVQIAKGIPFVRVG